jgi:hypothetical protein
MLLTRSVPTLRLLLPATTAPAPVASPSSARGGPAAQSLLWAAAVVLGHSRSTLEDRAWCVPSDNALLRETPPAPGLAYWRLRHRVSPGGGAFGAGGRYATRRREFSRRRPGSNWARSSIRTSRPLLAKPAPGRKPDGPQLTSRRGAGARRRGRRPAAGTPREHVCRFPDATSCFEAPVS